MRAFSDWQNIEILTNEEADAFFVRRKDEGNFGLPKLLGLFSVLKILRSHKDRLRYCVFGHNSEWLAEIITEICQILGFEVVSKAVGGADVTVTRDTEGYDLIVDSGCSEIGRRALLANYLSKSSGKAAYFQSNLTSIVREDAQVSRRDQIVAIGRAGFQVVFATYYGAFIKGCLPPSPASGPRPSIAMQNKCVFVVGHARSGSSAITHVLNAHDDINVLFEANFHIRKNVHSIAENFNAIQRKYGRPIEKGFYLPSYYGSAEDVSTLYLLMLQRYKLVGDKMAYGARGAFYECHPVEELFDFVMESFPHSKYVITIRHPKTAMVAMSRMIPDLSVDLLIDFWLGGIIRMIDLLLISERAITLFHEDSASEKKNALHALLDDDLGDAWEIYREENVTTSDEMATAYWSKPEWMKYNDMLMFMSESYQNLRDNISTTTGRIHRPKARQSVMDIKTSLANAYAVFLATK